MAAVLQLERDLILIMGEPREVEMENAIQGMVTRRIKDHYVTNGVAHKTQTTMVTMGFAVDATFVLAYYYGKWPWQTNAQDQA
jgi:hypothetical protein